MTEGRPTISTHVLDAERGAPAVGVGVLLQRHEDDGSSTVVAERATDDDGRIRDLIGTGGTLEAGYYELTFDVASYAEKTRGDAGFFQVVSLVLEIRDTDRSYHVPLLLSPYAMTTYRGS